MRVPRDWLLVLAALVVGLVAWSGVYQALAVAIVFPAVWFAAERRVTAWGVALAYYLGATIGLLFGSGIYFGRGMVLGAAIWFSFSLLCTPLWAIMWHRLPQRRAFGLALALVLVAAPPFGTLAVAHPVTAAGLLFPGFGLLGLLACLGLMIALPWIRCRPGQAVVGFLSVLSIAAHVSGPQGRAIDSWEAMDTAFPSKAAEEPDFLMQFRQQTETIAMANRASARVCVFPETSGGIWNDATAELWSERLRRPDQTSLLGALVFQGDSASYDNAIIAVNKTGARVVYSQRMPSPVSMWQPWHEAGARAHWFASPVIQIEGQTVAPLVCFEQYLIWPVIHSLAHRPTVILATGNLWWAEKTTLPALQRSIVRAWSALAGIPSVIAFNV